MRHLLLYDGECSLCDGAVTVILNHNAKETIYFVSLQSDKAKQLHKEFEIDSEVDSIVFIRSDGRVFYKASAAAEVCRQLHGIYTFGRILPFLPFSDRLYDWIARNRYRIFGKKESCPLPSAEVKARFINY
ncbi:thiol-disulfide oxidoreductase DCC family protein [Bacillus daqingensis]|uniref:Thiol-disulfide oxidoreductase DCC family protein n=1 Tax=Bacillus daqingensis TaxID=872396 RepID=A0ABV9NR33_9BACI